MKAKVLIFLALFVFIVLFFHSVYAEETVEAESDSTIIISGKIDHPEDMEIPDDARVVIFWTIPEPYSFYLFGEGELYADADSFQIELVEKPPKQVWLPSKEDAAIAIGTIFLTTNQEISEELLRGNFDLAGNMIGAADDYGLIFVEGSMEGVGIDWMEQFDSGYTIGKAVDLEDEVFSNMQGFVPVEPNGVKIRIMDMDEFRFVNWF
jgi:hypothetical protein